MPGTCFRRALYLENYVLLFRDNVANKFSAEHQDFSQFNQFCEVLKLSLLARLQVTRMDAEKSKYGLFNKLACFEFYLSYCGMHFHKIKGPNVEGCCSCKRLPKAQIQASSNTLGISFKKVEQNIELQTVELTFVQRGSLTQS